MLQNILQYADILLSNRNLNIRENHHSVYEQFTNPEETALSIYPEVTKLLGNMYLIDQLNGQHILEVVTIRVMPDHSLHIIHSPQDSRRISTDQDIDRIVTLLLQKVRAVYQYILVQQENGSAPLPEATAGRDIAQTQLTTGHQERQLQTQMGGLCASPERAQAGQRQLEEPPAGVRGEYVGLEQLLRGSISELEQSQVQLAQSREERSQLEEQCKAQRLEMEALSNVRTENKNLRKKVVRLKVYLRRKIAKLKIDLQRKNAQLIEVQTKILEFDIMHGNLQWELYEANIQADNQRDKIQELKWREYHLKAAQEIIEVCFLKATRQCAPKRVEIEKRLIAAFAVVKVGQDIMHDTRQQEQLAQDQEEKSQLEERDKTPELDIISDDLEILEALNAAAILERSEWNRGSA